MIRRFKLVPTLAALVLAFGGLMPFRVEASDLSKFLREMFSEMSGRPPSGSELNYHAELNRNGGSLENAIVLFGSDEVYATQAHGDPNLYVARMFETFLGRQPRPDEQAFWVNQMMQPGYRRSDMVRWFCQSNHITQLPSFLPTPPAYYPPTNQEEISLQLVDRANLLMNFINSEFGNSYFGNKVVERGARLLTLAKDYRNVFRSPNSTPQQVQVVLTNLDRALQDLEQHFYQMPGSSAQSKQVLQQVAQLVAAAQAAGAGWGQWPSARPPSFPPPSNPSVPQSVVVEVDRLVDESRRFAYGLLSYQAQGPFYANLSRDVQGMSTRVESLSLMVRQGQRPVDLQRAMQGIVDESRHISQDVSRAGSDIQRGWWNLQAQLRRTASALGVNSDYNLQPSRPVVIDRPAWTGFPFQPSPSQPASYQQECVALSDQLIGKIEDYSQSLTPVASTNRNAAELIGSLREFERYVLAFRQSATGGLFSTSLSSSADRMMGQYQALAREVTRMVGNDPSLNSPVFYQIGELVQQIRRAAGGV